MNHPTLIPALSQALAQGLPGAEAQYKMAHTFRMQQLKDIENTPQPGHRVAAVMAMLFLKNEQWHTALIRRTPYDDVHSRQVSFPGGGIEPADGGDLRLTALRETQEEIGVPMDKLQIIGQLSQLYIPVSNNLVHPFVGVIHEEPSYKPDPNEVESVIEAPLALFLQDGPPARTDIEVHNGMTLRDVPYYDVHGHVVWGATAMMLSELATIIQSVRLD
jgi:8-oxo-dGTP pyrophosphatase MutT (NUDIX family)